MQFLFSFLCFLAQTAYICNMFFMVLDFKVNEDWVVGMTTFSFSF